MVHSCCRKRQDFLFIEEKYSIVYVCDTFSSSILPNNGHLGWLHVLAIAKNAVMNLCMQEPLKNSALISFGYVPRSRTAESSGNSVFSIFEEPTYCAYSFPQRRYHFILPPTVHKGPHFSTSLPTLAIFSLFWVEINFIFYLYFIFWLYHVAEGS